MAKRKAKVVAVLGRNRRVGRWKISSDSLVVAVFGKCHLDLTRAIVEEDEEELSLKVFALFGSVSILLPEGSLVVPSGVAIAASTIFDLASTGEPTALAPVDLEWTACLARVRVTEQLISETLPPTGFSPTGFSSAELSPAEVPVGTPVVAGATESVVAAEPARGQEPTGGQVAPKTASITEGIPRPVPGPLRAKAGESASS